MTSQSSLKARSSLDDKPFFSILIPTRGRPDLLRDALVSALFQDFDDFEVVVSDNHNDDQTKKVLDTFRGHPRLRCIRPDRLLPMHENWEFASQNAKGAYVMFLTDRSVLKRHALRTIHDKINTAETDVLVCSWRWSLYDDIARGEFGDIHTSAGQGEILSTQFIASDFTTGAGIYPYSLPRGLNSCCKKELITTLQQKYGTVFRPISPDFTSAFLLLASVDNVLFIDQALFISQGLRASNGGNAYLRTAEDYLMSLGEQNWFSMVPIKAPLVENTIFQDYLSIQSLAGGTLTKVGIEWPVYFEKCYLELVEKEGAGYISKCQMKKLFTNWSTALDGSDDFVKNEVQKKLKNLRWRKIKAKLKGSLIGPFARRQKLKIDNIRHHGWQVRAGQSVLEAAGFNSEIFHP